MSVRSRFGITAAGSDLMWFFMMLVAGAFLPGEVRAYDGIVAFGDSLTDNGAGVVWLFQHKYTGQTSYVSILDHLHNSSTQ